MDSPRELGVQEIREMVFKSCGRKTRGPSSCKNGFGVREKLKLGLANPNAVLVTVRGC